MANCTKCSAELIGPAKYCAACGSPVVQQATGEQGPSTLGGLSATTRSNQSVSASPSGGPVGHVNPFAATSRPTSRAVEGAPPAPGLSPAENGEGGVAQASQPAAPAAEAKEAPAFRPSTPPPGTEGSPVSPLAVSSAHSERGAFQQAMEQVMDKARSSVTPPAAPVRPNKAGTQVMPSAPGRPLPRPGDTPAPQEAAPSPKKAPPRTVAMSFGGALPGGAAPNPTPGGVASSTPQGISGPAQPPSVVQPSVAHSGTPVQPHGAMAPTNAPHQMPPNAVQPAGPHPGVAQPSGFQHQPQGAIYAPPPPPAMGQPPMAQPGAPYNAAPAYPQQPAGPGGWGWNHGPMPAAPPPMVQYPFGYAPGSRVQVTWSNGQRYPATVSQVSGTQCLVVFPDGQQHWVEMQYLSPS